MIGYGESKQSCACFLAYTYTQKDAGWIAMRVYIGEVVKPLHDIRGNSWGIVYRSARGTGGECIAALGPPIVSIPKQGAHLSYVWNEEQIVNIYWKMFVG